MGSPSKTMHKLSTIDLTNLKPGSDSWIATSTQVTTALEEYGCFVAVYDKIPFDLHEAVFGQLQQLFDLPLETKAKNTSTKPLYGYVGQIPFLPLYESLGIDYSNTLEGVQSFTNVMWPNGNDTFSETILSYTKLAAELEQNVAKMVFESYGVDKYYESHHKAATYLCRATKYEIPEGDKSKLGLVPHTDKNFITVLHQNQINGLEVQAKDGQWFPVELEPSSFIIISCDAAMAWSNNRLYSPYHRVTMNGNGTRYSIALFTFQEGKMVETPEDLVDEKHPLQFKPFDHLKYLEFYSKEENRRLPNGLQNYCGVV